MDRLSAMANFVRVVEAGGFSAVARELQTTQSAVSKQVAALEKHLGVRLLSRTTRSLSLTQEGRAYFESAQRIVADAEEAEHQARVGQQALGGKLRVGASVAYGRLVLFEIARKFLADHPDISLDLEVSDQFVDIVAAGLDVAVRIGELADSSLLAQRVGTTQRAVIAAKSYLETLPKGLAAPKVPSDLTSHSCVIYTGLATQNLWSFNSPDGRGNLTIEEQVRVSGRIASNSSEVVRNAVLSGMGIGFSPTWLFADEIATGAVVCLMPTHVPPPLPIHMVYPASRRNSAKVAAFIAAVKAGIAP